MEIIKIIDKNKKTITVNMSKSMYKNLKALNKHKYKNMHQQLLSIIIDVLNEAGHTDEELKIIRTEI